MFKKWIAKSNVIQAYAEKVNVSIQFAVILAYASSV